MKRGNTKGAKEKREIRRRKKRNIEYKVAKILACRKRKGKVKMYKI